ncbi:hypothetical protein L21SP2_0681 [Salinispira pacifica]|uniref:Uncharacterized protein n=1 Tax=Salinispira pacifica TaxID=1307761 RepID=V5WE82_9SPIO|nr:hypothetical protein L21SP2_0681 [Salinispira pacifica]
MTTPWEWQESSVVTMTAVMSISDHSPASNGISAPLVIRNDYSFSLSE